MVIFTKYLEPLFVGDKIKLPPSQMWQNRPYEIITQIHFVPIKYVYDRQMIDFRDEDDDTRRWNWFMITKVYK